VTPTYSVGDLELVSLTDGTFALDGGAMFGVIPKVLWSRVAAADDRNRIPLAMRPLLVRGRQTLLIDTGIGDKLDAKSRDIFAVDRAVTLDGSLAAAGLTAADVDIVLATHLHFDHAGGFTVRGADGVVRPRFPNARYFVRRGEWDDAWHPHERNRASYLADNYASVEKSGQLTLVDDDAEIMPGVRTVRTGGHTAHHQLVRIESRGQTAVFMADLIPTAAHVPLPWIMGYDLYPMDTLAFKRSFLTEAATQEYLVFFEHEPAFAAGHFRTAGDAIVLERA
jgi:glyoxylase-like metal-dependent hydrolase (beta-lactamase superfamily II)